MARTADPATAEPAHQVFLVHQDHQSLRDTPAQTVESSAESLGLRDGAGKTIHEETVGGIRLLQAVFDDADHYLVRD